MSRPDPESQNLTAEDFEFHDEEEALEGPGAGVGARGNRSDAGMMGTKAMPYRLPPAEQLRGVANRIIFSQYYIIFYLIMFGLSLATIVISLLTRHSCPPPVWHILEFIINGLMVLEVGTRWVAYGKKYPLTLLNVVDLILVLFCVVTLLLVINSPCSDGTRSEETLDLILLIARNGVQFLRLLNILRRSGHSLLNPPKPMDLSQARSASLALNLDMDDDEAIAEQQLSAGAGGTGSWGLGDGGRRTLAGGGRYETVFSDETPEQGSRRGSRRGSDSSQTQGKSNDREARKPLDLKQGQGRETLTQEDEEAWDRLG